MQHLDAAMLSARVIPQVPAERRLQSTRLSYERGFILNIFVAWENDRAKHKDWAFSRHAETLREIGKGPDSEKLKSVECCVFCLTGPPQHILECGHSLCDACVPRFAVSRRYRRSSFMVKGCMMCGTPSQLEVQLKPATAGIRVLSIDGGGIRGIVPLQFLHNLQCALGGAVRVQDFFDMAFGVSAGMSHSCPSLHTNSGLPR